MNKVPAFFSKCGYIKGEVIKCKTNIKGIDDAERIHLKKSQNNTKNNAYWRGPIGIILLFISFLNKIYA